MRLLSVLVVATFAGTAAGPAAGQPPAAPPGPPLPPAFSPYLNLNRSGGNPAINYYGIVRPQVQTNAAILGLQSQAAQINPYTATNIGADQPVVTGNPFGFQNYRGFFQNQYLGGAFNTAGSYGGVGGRPGVGGPGVTGGVGAMNQQFGVPSPPRRR